MAQADQTSEGVGTAAGTPALPRFHFAQLHQLPPSLADELKAQARRSRLWLAADAALIGYGVLQGGPAWVAAGVVAGVAPFAMAGRFARCCFAKPAEDGRPLRIKGIPCGRCPAAGRSAFGIVARRSLSTRSVISSRTATAEFVNVRHPMGTKHHTLCGVTLRSRVYGDSRGGASGRNVSIGNRPKRGCAFSSRDENSRRTHAGRIDRREHGNRHGRQRRNEHGNRRRSSCRGNSLRGSSCCGIRRSNGC